MPTSLSCKAEALKQKQKQKNAKISKRSGLKGPQKKDPEGR
jgi:hypothetical protein